MLTLTRPRAKWGIRSPEPPPIIITQRDLNLLAHLAWLRFLTPEQLGTLDGGSEQGVSRCLRALFDHGFVDQLGDLFGRRAYALTRKGARLLNENGHLVDSRSRWSLRNKRAGAKFLQHTLEIGDVLIALHVACRKRRDVSLMLEPDIIAAAPEKTRRAREPLRWTAPGAKAKHGVNSVISDGLFGLRFSDDTAAIFLLELDRGHEPLNRNRGRLEQTSIGRKLSLYYEGWKANRQVEQFGVKQLRVAFVTTSMARVANMVEAVKQMTGGTGSNLFLFAAHDSVVANDPLELQWVSGRGEPVRLCE